MQESYAAVNLTARPVPVRAISPEAPNRLAGVYCPHEEGTCCNK